MLQEVGNYSFYFRLKEGQETVATTEVSQFSVQPSAKNGILHANDNWTLKYDSGKPFRGIGENVGWEARDWENQKHTYDYFLPKLAENGVNFFRTWTCIWNLPIEWKTVINTNFYTSTTAYFNPSGVQRMDELMEMLDSLDMHLMLALVPHGALITNGEWPRNPYNVINGGPASTPTEFFTLVESKQKFKNTLRYLVARWGYSPGIGAWEFINEIDNAAYNGGGTLSIPHAAITQWHAEMSAYLREIDIYRHPITTSISHREIAGLYNVPDIDINQQHIYNNTSTIPEKINHYKDAYNKPFVVGEFGWDWNWDNVLPENGPNFDFDLKRGLWYGLFTSTPILPMSWWWEFFDERGMTPYYRNIADVSEQMLLAGDGDFSPVSVSAFGFEKYAVKCGSSYFVYLLNNSTNPNGAEVKLPVDKDEAYFVSRLDPEINVFSNLDQVTPSSGEISLGRIELKSREAVVFILSLDQASVGHTNPYLGNENNLPGIIEAEDFDEGLEGAAFHDLDGENIGGVYRPDVGVDIFEEAGVSFVGEVVKDEWLKYTVQFTESGVYSATMKVSVEETGKTFRLLLDGTPVTDVVEVPQTGAANWQTIDILLNVSQIQKGKKSLVVEFLDSGFWVDQIGFSLENKAPVINLVSPEGNSEYDSPTTILLKAEAVDEDGEIEKVAFYNSSKLIGEVLSAPYEYLWELAGGNSQIFALATDNSGLVSSTDTLSIQVNISHVLPGTIEAEDYDAGENGVAYLDLSDGNKFGFYRNDDVDLESCSDEGGGFSVGDFQTGEWLNYTVQVESEGRYQVDIRVASQMDGGKLSLSVNGVSTANSVDIPNTGGWQTWTSVSVQDVFFEEGESLITLGAVSQFVNVNSLIFSNTTSSKHMEQPEIKCYPNPVATVLYLTNLQRDASRVMVYNNLGECVKIEDSNQESFDMSNLASGFYNLVILSSKGEMIGRTRFIKF